MKAKSPGFTISISAPSATSKAASMSASRPLAGSCWYVFLSPKPYHTHMDD
jgi:hypothetical protein